MESLQFKTNSEEETISLGKSFAEKLHQGDVVAFYGDLGAGKTEFIKGICEHFGVNELVTSPTFTIINQYEGHDETKHEIPIYHLDLYRVENDNDLAEIGFKECIFSNESIKLVEWAEKAQNIIPKSSYNISIKSSETVETERYISIEHL